MVEIFSEGVDEEWRKRPNHKRNETIRERNVT